MIRKPDNAPQNTPGPPQSASPADAGPADATPESVTRPVGDVVAMVRVTQANVVQLRTAEAKRRRTNPDDHQTAVPSPGAVTRFRDCLIDWRTIRGYSDGEIHARLREQWGRYCVLCWALSVKNPHDPPNWSNDGGLEIRCPTTVEIKAAEINGWLWRLKYEQRLRADPSYQDEPGFARDRAMAREIGATVFGQKVADCDDDALLTAVYEHLGMCAAVRWIADPEAEWNDPNLMNVNVAALFGESG